MQQPPPRKECVGWSLKWNQFLTYDVVFSEDINRVIQIDIRNFLILILNRDDTFLGSENDFLKKPSGNHVKFLKNLHTEQLAKLQLKNQHECELLEDIRQFTIKRSAIEKSYSEALLKISSAYLNKKMANIPEIKFDGTEKWNMWSVWQTVLEENEKLAKARLAAIEVFQQQIADEAKNLREYKIHISKKCVNQLGNIQKKVQTTVQKVDITKKSYFDEEHSAHGVRDKARDIEEKLKKKKGPFFQSITSLQKNSARVTSRKEELEEKSTGARNDYLLSLSQANAHQNRYFAVDLQTTMTTMENYVFERIAEYLTLMGRTELLTCSATQNSFSKIRDQAQQLTREYNVQCCYLFYPVLKQHIQYEYEPCDNDLVTKITAEHDSAAATLSREAKMFASRIVRENNSIRDSARKLAICVQMRDAGQRTDPNDPNGPDLKTKMEEFRENIRKSETEKAKSEACLECLRAGGVNVDEWMQEAETLGVQEIPRSSSSLSMRTDASGQGEQQSTDSFYDSDNTDQEAHPSSTQKETAPRQPEVIEDDSSQSESDDGDVDAMLDRERQKIEQLTAGWEYPTTVDWGAEDSSTQPDTVPASTEPIFKCTALYSYSAQNPDELTIVENEQLEVIGEGDGDGWLRARNYRGEEGYVPHNYLDVERDVPVDSSSQQQLQTQMSFSSVDYTIENEDQEAYQDSTVQSPDQVSVISAPVAAKSNEPQQEWCIALYDYDASAEDELTFEENQIIKIVNKSPHGVDDGWWEGELNGVIGNFPSLVVEECDANGEPLTESDDETPPPSIPPVFSPPKAPMVPFMAELQQAVQKVEVEMENQSRQEVNSERFEIELSGNKQKHYGKQFAGAPTPVLVLETDSGSGSDHDHTDDGEDTEPVVKQPTEAKSKKVVVDDHPVDIGLGFVHISVTAATPMVEDAEKTFKDTIEEEDESEEQDESFEKDITEAVDEILEEAQAQTASVVAISQPTAKPQMPSKPPPTNPPPHPPPNTPPKKPPTRPTQPPPQPEADNNQFDANFDANFEANFEANFDDAFGESPEPEPPKQVVGGRASIPDDLDSAQLARLQNLKESNA